MHYFALVTILLVKKEVWISVNTVAMTLKLAADYYWNDLSWNELENCHLEPTVISNVK